MITMCIGLHSNSSLLMVQHLLLDNILTSGEVPILTYRPKVTLLFSSHLCILINVHMYIFKGPIKLLKPHAIHIICRKVTPSLDLALLHAFIAFHIGNTVHLFRPNLL